jgi:AcrR family transcriptional regulator
MRYRLSILLFPVNPFFRSFVLKYGRPVLSSSGMGRQKTYDRDTVLEKAMKLFWKQGYEGTSLDEIVKTTGLNRFSLYKEFGGKMGLFREALRRYLTDFQEVSGILEEEPLGLANIRAYLKRLAQARFLHGCFMLNTMTEKHHVSRSTFGEIRRFLEGAEQAFLANLEAARERGEVSKETDIEGLAKSLMAIDMGMVMMNILNITDQDKMQIVGAAERMLG